MRSETAVRRRLTEVTTIEGTTGERSRRSIPVLWAWLDLNQRPHPYQQSRAERHADRCFPWWAANVEGQVILCNSIALDGVIAADPRCQQRSSSRRSHRQPTAALPAHLLIYQRSYRQSRTVLMPTHLILRHSHLYLSSRSCCIPALRGYEAGSSSRVIVSTSVCSDSLA